MRYLLLLLLVGCSSTAPVIVKTERVVKQAPPEMYTLPAPVTDVDMSTQKGVSIWIIKSEERMNTCQDKLNALEVYFRHE